MTLKEDLENNKTDYLTSIAKATLGMVPYLGPFLSEIIGSIIPNQRMDRLSKYLVELNETLEKIPVEKLSIFLNNEAFLDLIEESFLQASRVLTEERRQYIISIISHGLSEENIKMEESKYLLRLLQEINDTEIIWLMSFYLYSSSFNESQKYIEKNKAILQKYIPDESRESRINRLAFSDGYKEHLERLGLIETEIKYTLDERKTSYSETLKKSVRTDSKKTKITTLGIILLYKIGLIEKLRWETGQSE